ncbi:MAG: opacity protein-like surface antigen [Sulfurimonas sp.]|jgi:opacity protein-like surface antigen|uniref:outer membrane beta-barrel protein n=1 Tax=Sulfurimonas sp. TaxID=2022749 RepID=UPI0039E67EFA
MKKIIMGTALIVSIFTTQAFAGSNTYVGIDMISSGNTLTRDSSFGSVSADIDSKAFKLKLGVKRNNGWRFQGYYLRETYDIALFDLTNDTLNEIGVDIIKGFEVTPEFSPFIQAGVGVGSMSVTGYAESSILEYNFKVGAGMMYKVIPQLELIAGVDLQYRAWQDIQTGYTIYSTTEKNTKFYAGMNYHF